MEKFAIACIKFAAFFYSLNGVSQPITQPDTTFVRYLVAHKLDREITEYLSRCTEDNPLTVMTKARYALYSNQDSVFFALTNQHFNLISQDISLINMANSYFLNPLNQFHKPWFSMMNSNLLDFQNTEFQYVLDAAYSNGILDEHNFPEDLEASYLQMKKKQQKKLYIAGGLSILVPGLGKWYAGSRSSFISTLTMNLSFGIQLFESLRNRGIRHPISIINLSVLGIFYTANVFGSIHTLKTQKKILRNQFLINASQYYATSSAYSYY